MVRSAGIVGSCSIRAVRSSLTSNRSHRLLFPLRLCVVASLMIVDMGKWSESWFIESCAFPHVMILSVISGVAKTRSIVLLELFSCRVIVPVDNTSSNCASSVSSRRYSASGVGMLYGGSSPPWVVEVEIPQHYVLIFVSGLPCL